MSTLKQELTEKTKALVTKARCMVEDFDDNYAAMTVGFDKEFYILTNEQLDTIMCALYHADCELNNLKD